MLVSRGMRNSGAEAGSGAVTTLAEGTMPALLLFSALFLIPPLLSLRACLERARHLRRHGRGATAARGGVAFSAAALLVNLAVVGRSALAAAGGDMDLGPLHALAAILAWLCLWVWVLLLLLLRRKRRKTVY